MKHAEDSLSLWSRVSHLASARRRRARPLPVGTLVLTLFMAACSASTPEVDVAAADEGIGSAGDVASPDGAGTPSIGPVALTPDVVSLDGAGEVEGEDAEVLGPQDTVASESADVCDCDPGMWCDDGSCASDVCTEGEVSCHDLETRRVCADDGSRFDLVPCPDDLVCQGDQCVPLMCQPSDPPFCDGPTRMTCNSSGLAHVPLPCPGGTGCVDGTCQPIEPNVLLLVDTSTSMSLLADTPDMYPPDCMDASCPVWDFPVCDDPNDPMTRIARVKVSISEFLQSDAAQEVRLALMRFPQTGLELPNCTRGYYAHLFFMSGDNHAPETELDWFTSQLHQTLCTGFSETSESNLEDMARWLDFEETLAPTGQGCSAFWDCEFELCDGGQCWSHTNPELRGTGPTPLGKSLFYAGEYLRHLVLNEGKPCGVDADCNSPHYACVSGACRDPFFSCRETSIILFTDGFETVYESTEEFFNPLVQAKRLHYGLACVSDEDCLSGADCVDGGCRFEGEGGLPQMQCNAYESPCTTDDDCAEFECGKEAPCEGSCQDVTVDLFAPEWSNHLASAEGAPLPITVHVIDASGTVGSNQLLATYGGGEYSSSDLAELSTLTSQLGGLVTAKPGASICE
ncbi:MAG: hypothetical protein ACPGU1_19295 [Myxococcota bacterium]